MPRLYFITPYLSKSYDQISFFTKGSPWYQYHLKYALGLRKQAFIYELELKNVTTDIRDKKENKLLKINNYNKDFFSAYNFKTTYFHNKQYYYPYPFCQLCHPIIYKNFVGIDATEYEKVKLNENFTLEGMIWYPEKAEFNLELIDYITSLPK